VPRDAERRLGPYSLLFSVAQCRPGSHIHSLGINVAEGSALGEHAAHVHVNLERVRVGRGIEPARRLTNKVVP
jgi:hypothetical protein